MAQRTLAATPLNPVLQEWITSHASSINRIAATLGIPATALASAPAEEASHIISAKRGRHKYYPSKNPIDFIQDSIVTPVLPHGYYADDYADRESDIKGGKKPSTESNFIERAFDYIRRPTKNDVGWGNVNIGSAILYLREYLSEVGPGKKYEGDPLNLAQYESNYRKMAADLVDPRSDLTFKMAGLVLKRADNAFVNIYDDQYLLLPEDRQAALLVTAYKQGVQRIINNVQTDLLVGSVPVLSDPAAGDGAPFTLFNYPTIKNLIRRPIRFGAPVDPASEIAGAEAPNPGSDSPGRGVDAVPSQGPGSSPWRNSWGGAGDLRNKTVQYASPSQSSPNFHPYGADLSEPSQNTALEPMSALRKPYGDLDDAQFDRAPALRTNPNAEPNGNDFLSRLAATLARINSSTSGANGIATARPTANEIPTWLPRSGLRLGMSGINERVAPPLWNWVDQGTHDATAQLPSTFEGFMPPGFNSNFGWIWPNGGGREDSALADVPSGSTVGTSNTPWGGAYSSPASLNDLWNQTSSYAWRAPFRANSAFPAMPAQLPSWLQSVMPSGASQGSLTPSAASPSRPEIRGLLSILEPSTPTDEAWDQNIPSWWRPGSW